METTKKLNVTSTSQNSAEVNEVVLSESDLVKIVFKPIIVKNQHEINKSVKGKLVYQKKRKCDQFTEVDKLSKSSMRTGEWMEISLDTREVSELFEGLKSCYSLFGSNGIEFGNNEYLVVSSDYEKLIKLLEEEPELIKKLAETNPKIIKGILELLSEKAFDNEIFEDNTTLTLKELENISSSLNISRLIKLLSIWEENFENTSEEFWQNLFTENAWIISQCFGSPTVFLAEKAFIGGKNISNKGGNIVDFLYQNELTKNVALIEIKRPITKLVKKEYRQTFIFDDELNGAINQVLNYRNELVQNYKNLVADDTEEYYAINPKCFVIIGLIKGLSPKEVISFENYRNELKNVEIITFDELYSRIKIILDLLKF
ncbi:Shedu immune nuclease family protein [Fusibacter ferrireducens]|uniref:DUF4263 domain-containing protein n=1 Tax=Fusibacter ferrireducens TaxID=2785058 RepID=A0ABS0A027_9FIRM|nr:Shedu immune nuclease family protein [Fusibacter ferrireducens]MBF4696059.1 DUF4263 domain-containing protein [Fusibacter ferrireducens]